MQFLHNLLRVAELARCCVGFFDRFAQLVCRAIYFDGGDAIFVGEAVKVHVARVEQKQRDELRVGEVGCVWRRARCIQGVARRRCHCARNNRKCQQMSQYDCGREHRPSQCLRAFKLSARGAASKLRAKRARSLSSGVCGFTIISIDLFQLFDSIQVYQRRFKSWLGDRCSTSCENQHFRRVAARAP